MFGRRFFSTSENAFATDKVLKSLVKPLILDVRDRKEVVAGRGGPPKFIHGSINVPINIDGQKQSDRSTTQDEFLKKIIDAGLTLTNKEAPIITHCCEIGKRASKAEELLTNMGYTNVHNGGNSANISRVLGLGEEKKATDNSQKYSQEKAYKKPSFLDDEYDHLAQPGATGNIGDEEFLPDYMGKDAPEFKRNQVAINLPWLIGGAPFNDLKTRFMGEQVFSRMKVHKSEVLEHLFKIYRAVLLSAQDKDFDFLEQYCEEMFYTKLRNRLNQLNSEGLTLKVEEDLFADRGKPLQIEANMYDHVIVKGLSPVRRENGSEEDYFIYNDIENMGLISYVPKYLTDPNNFSDPSRNKIIHDEAHKLTYRCYVTFKSGYKLHLKDKYGNDQFDYDNENYTWQHVGVFESQMEAPQKFSSWSQSENLMEWIAKHKFGTWRMVDLDNWLVGNPLVIPKFDVRKRTASDRTPTDLFSQ